MGEPTRRVKLFFTRVEVPSSFHVIRTTTSRLFPRLANLTSELDVMKAGMSLDHGIIGESAAMRALGRQIRTAASCDLTVLVSGESGTGKELVAKAIHFQSGRSKKPFVSLNCGALTETLLESELFGYERGAFTGAHQKRKGLFEAAHTGTLFLDEIAEMSTGCQVKLLRVLQESAFRPVGGHTE